MLAFISAATMIASLLSAPGRAMPLYGQDNRKDLYQVKSPEILALADSTVALFESDKVSLRGGRAGLATESYAEAHNLCKTEPFREQRIGPFCSGSLVGPDLVLTAGHCVKRKRNCAATKIVFGFALRKAGELPESVPAGEVYGCAEIVERKLKKDGRDWELIRLDRPVKNHAPLSIDPDEASAGAPVLAIGHPNGLPAKVAGGAFVLDDKPKNYFTADLDTYHGNSGSPVFDARTGKIVGILASGEDDFEQAVEEDFRRFGSCNKSRVCTGDKCDGEEVTKVSVFLNAVSRAASHPPAVALKTDMGPALASLKKLAQSLPEK